MTHLLRVSFVLMAAGCAAQVGDACEPNNDCGRELSCDLSQTAGYCTVSPCAKNECPTEAVCIAFDDGTSHCMARCESTGDCRDEYVCVDNYGDAPFCNSHPYLGP